MFASTFEDRHYSLLSVIIFAEHLAYKFDPARFIGSVSFFRLFILIGARNNLVNERIRLHSQGDGESYHHSPFRRAALEEPIVYPAAHVHPCQQLIHRQPTRGKPVGKALSDDITERTHSASFPREQRRVLFYAYLRFRGVVRVQFNADKVHPEAGGDETDGSHAREGVEDDAADRTPGG